MSGEKSVKSGHDGHVVAEKLLKKLGWLPNSNIDYICALGEKHKTAKSKSERQNHNLDILIERNSALNHDYRDAVLVSVKHITDKYPSGLPSTLQSHLKDLAQCIECASEYDCLLNEELISNNGRTFRYYGLIVWLSSNTEEQNYDVMNKIIEKYDEEQITTSSIRYEFDTIFLLDNNRTTFVYSAFETAKMYAPNAKLKFFYHDTGTNIKAEDLTTSDVFLPIELMFSNLLPIVLQNEQKTSILIFCNDLFDKDYLKRVIWFIIKNNMGFSNEILIYFKDYDTTIHDTKVNAVKNIFIQDQEIIHKIHIKKFDTFSFIRLKEETTNVYDNTSSMVVESKEIKVKQNVDSNIDHILPYGTMLMPILSSSMLSAKDLKDFLMKKGIFVKGSDKEDIVPIFTNFLLTPNELNELKEKLVQKEDKHKNLPLHSAEWVNNNNKLDDALKNIDLTTLKVAPNCKIIEPTTLKFSKKNNNTYELNITLERTNTTKDLLSGVTRHDSNITISLVDNRLNIKSVYTALETKKLNTKILDSLGKYLKNNNYIEKPIKSVYFGDFTNVNRVDFIMAFHNNIIEIGEIFSNSSVLNIKFKPDDTIENLPNDLETMKGNVSNLNITGNNLDKLSYVRDFKNYILLERVKIKTTFYIDGNTGTCEIEIGFPSALNSRTNVDNDAELQTTIENIKPTKTKFTITTNKLQRSISHYLEKFLDQKFNNLKKA